MDKFFTTSQVAETVGITRQALLSRAKTRGVGFRFGREWLFTDKDLAILVLEVPKGNPNWQKHASVG